MVFQSWLARMLRERRPDRYSGNRILAYFWDGGTPIGHAIKDVSSSGAYIYATERWYAGTVLEIAFREVTHPAKSSVEAVTFTVQCKVVRHGADGMAVAFMFRHPEQQYALQKLLDRAKVKPASLWELGKVIKVILPHAE